MAGQRRGCPMKGDRRTRWWQRWLGILFLPLILAACSGPVESVWLNAPDWKRAVLVGQTLIPDAVPIAFDEAGNMYLFFINETDGVARPQLLALNRNAEVLWETELDVELDLPDEPRILWDGEHLRLFWLNSRRLFTAEMDPNGELLGSAQALSPEGRASTYDVALSENQTIAVWYGGTRQEPGLYALPPGNLSGDAVLLDEQGLEPKIQYSSDNTLHAVWMQYPPGASQSTFYYAAYANGQPTPGQESVVARARVGLSTSLEGPYLGIEDETAYLFWSAVVRTGLEAGTAETRYVTYALQEPEQASEPKHLNVPEHYDLTYEPAANRPFIAGPRVPLDEQNLRAVPMNLETNNTLSQELVVAAEVSIAYELRKQASQATLVFFENGSARDYQLLSFTRTATSSPYVRSDEDGYLYATWLEPADERGFLIYFGSTAPDLQAVLGNVSVDDVGRMAAETVFGMLAGVLLSPFLAMLWLIGPLLVLAITSFFRRESEGLISAGSAASLVLAFVTYMAVKTLTLPGFLEYVPLSGWIPILPAWLEAPLRWGIPLIITIIALATAWHFTYRRRTQSVIYFMLIYGAVDSVVTLAFYGSLIYGFL